MLKDPLWLEMSASRRNDQIFVKMPRDRAREILLALNALPQDSLSGTSEAISSQLLEEEAAAGEFGLHSIFYVLTADQCAKDVQSLKEASSKDTSGILGRFADVLHKGLRNDIAVDWIHRVGGPARKPLDGLEPSETGEETLRVDLLS